MGRKETNLVMPNLYSPIFAPAGHAASIGAPVYSVNLVLMARQREHCFFGVFDAPQLESAVLGG